ncbi:carbohydrate ABC transporter permease [Rhizohabitans arisaemae]|uniref:carbohydrate ABC transporter permease n=1 Tax=Rhizohabitans arisaemae TaxID=2720610 RepID=UPI0024B0E7D7|nr:sugar ABC transporter permease [Rhizohabitans arisaemae]
MSLKGTVTTAPRRVSPSRRGQGVAGWTLVLPSILVLLVVVAVPIGYGFYLSLTSYNPVETTGPKFHGLTGYLQVLTSGEFWDALRVTVLYAFGTLALTVPAALGLALLVNGKFPGVALFRGAMYLPRVVSLVAVSMIWLWLYSREGYFNHLLDLVGLGPVEFLTDEATALPSLIVMRAWKALGGSMIIFLAGLQTIPKELIQSAAVDGAGRFRTFRHVTLPLLMPITTYVVVVDLIYLAQSFSEIYILTSGGPLGSTTVVNMLVYKEAFENFKLGEASSMAFVLFCMIFALAYANVRFLSRGKK